MSNSFRLELSERGIKELVSDGVAESKYLDFKKILPGRDERSRSEFLKDVCAFANCEGGYLIYGILEKSGKAGAICPITDEESDHAIRRLGQIIESGIEPRISGIQFTSILCEDGYTLSLRVPASFDGPHRFTSNGSSKFVIRNGTHTSELTYTQLRGAFDRTASLADRARTTWKERWESTSNGDTWKPIRNGPVCLIQFIPIASMTGRQMISMNEAHEHFSDFMFSDWGGASCTYNLDGLVVHDGDLSSEVGAFTQVHRTGVIEAYRTGGAIMSDRKLIPSTTIATFFRESVGKFLNAAKKFDLYGPAILNTAILNVAEYEFVLGERFYSRGAAMADRSNLILPEVWIEDSMSTESIDDIARPILDILWQSFGRPRCSEYDNSGLWAPR
ncbi:MAG: helix-turn-helix domain-containing protein [Sphingorhabdus sp.]|uniref:AlbA family DNA-binding domain-containing protein n=1 Tax=Sphingorhabdus sp. TaxID=1902408 RepID=UPI0038FC516D